MQKLIVRRVCRVPVLIPYNTMFLKTDLLTLNEVFDLQVCKLMQHALAGFNVDHSNFTPVYLVHLYCTIILKRLNFVIKISRTRLRPSSFRYLCSKFWSSVQFLVSI